MVKNWLITGGCGFIGISLISKILNSHPDSNIRILDNLSVGQEKDLASVTPYVKKEIHSLARPDKVELVVGDIKDPEVCNLAGQHIDCMVHLAANTGVGPSVEDPRSDMECNIVGTFNLLESARENGILKFIFASSGAPIGEVEPPIHEDLAARPVSPYGAGKLAGEGYCAAYYRSFGLDTV